MNLARARSAMLFVLFLLPSGCGSCLDGEGAPDAGDGPPTITTVMKATPAGARPVIVGDGARFAARARRDGGAEGAR